MHTRHLPNPLLALAPLVLVGVSNFALTRMIPQWYGAQTSVALPGLAKPVTIPTATVTANWAVEGALLLGIAFVLLTAFGGVIAALPGFLVVGDALKRIPGPLLNAAVSVSSLASITGSASGGMSIALAAMGDTFIHGAQAAGIPPDVLHRVVSMASGGMDTLPHNGAVITLLAVFFVILVRASLTVPCPRASARDMPIP